MSDPLHFIQQVFSFKNDLEHVSFPTISSISNDEDLTESEMYGRYEQYEEVVFNVYLFKGVHHFVQCTERLDVKHGEEMSTHTDAIEQNLPTLCTTDETYFPLKRNFEASDNLKFYVRPLECKDLTQF